MRTQYARAIGRTILTGMVATFLLAGQPSAAWAQTAQTERIMREKLAASQQLLAALVTSDWASLDRNTRAIQTLTTRPGWDVMRLPEYATHSSRFQRALEALRTAAGQRDQRQAVLAYNGVVTTCVECHSYVARARLASNR